METETKIAPECKCSGRLYPHDFKAAGCIAPAPVRFRKGAK